MADNVAFTPGTGATGATDDIGGVHYPRVKIALGPDGTANDAEAGAGAVDTGTMRVTLASDDPAVAALEAIETATPALGQGAMAASIPVAIASDQSAVPVSNTGLTALIKPMDGDYETIAASQTDQMMGATGATGDYLAGVLIIPATTSPGGVSIEDGSTNIVIFTGGASSVTNLVPFFVPLGIISVSGGWEITTGANVSAIAVGSFT